MNMKIHASLKDEMSYFVYLIQGSEKYENIHIGFWILGFSVTLSEMKIKNPEEKQNKKNKNTDQTVTCRYKTTVWYTQFFSN